MVPAVQFANRSELSISRTSPSRTAIASRTRPGRRCVDHELVDRLQRVSIDDGDVVEFGEGLRFDDSRDGEDDPVRVGDA